MAVESRGPRLGLRMRKMLGQSPCTLGRGSYPQLMTLGTWNEGQADPRTWAQNALRL